MNNTKIAINVSKKGWQDVKTYRWSHLQILFLKRGKMKTGLAESIEQKSEDSQTGMTTTKIFLSFLTMDRMEQQHTFLKSFSKLKSPQEDGRRKLENPAEPIIREC
ncbi:hypothetical protein BaRGS_00032346 [Batillaria attramentaria]|uniref:Uncharacterized protein n=1 Tax=Batillaria attramentaria TaxID=370345 RepID=A0ABD0JN83_9CAEN